MRHINLIVSLLLLPLWICSAKEQIKNNRYDYSGQSYTNLFNG